MPQASTGGLTPQSELHSSSYADNRDAATYVVTYVVKQVLNPIQLGTDAAQRDLLT